MKSSDPRLTLIAAMAKVRPPHVFHCFHSMAELGKGFDAESFAAFAQLEVKHVTAIVDALTVKDWLPSQPRASTRVQGSQKPHSTRLPSDFQAPDEWIMLAREKRFWTLTEATEEAESFIDHFHKTGQAYADWLAAWRGWVRRSHRANGTHSPHAEPPTPEHRRQYLERIIDLYEKQGRGSEAQDWRDELARIVSNVVPIRMAQK